MTHKGVSAEARRSAVESDYAALYAVAGLTDALAEALKGRSPRLQQKASKRISELPSRRPELSHLFMRPEPVEGRASTSSAHMNGRGKQAVDEAWKSARDRSDRATRKVTPRSTVNTSNGGEAAAKKGSTNEASAQKTN
jgi:hypothetical protein